MASKLSHKLIAGTMIVVSAVSAVLVQAPFTPAVVITLLMFVVALLYIVKKQYRVAIILLLINSLAILGLIYA
ncbi:MAG: hypothetical protein HKN50_11380 [Gammaproteobacteria bacterium]|nr:hypothetical protein [Gammaproteobacteria bacterium]